MEIRNAVVLITGASRGLGLEFAREARARGARKVYAAVRNPASVNLPGVEVIKLDVTNPEHAAQAAQQCRDVTVLINNAGIAEFGGFVANDTVASLRRQLETNVFGPLYLSRAFAPVLAANGGGAILNVLSVASWISGPMLGAYALTKSAAWSMTNGLRIELEAQQTQVLGLHVGFIDTDLTRDLDVRKLPPQLVVQRALNGLEAGSKEVLADEITQQVHQGLSANPAVYLQNLPRN
jgi:NAD(P)-dependent dehydrogenase (short-subunit alcohol dehydrogenase family)